MSVVKIFVFLDLNEKSWFSFGHYLEWAYVEAANYAKRFCPEAQRFYQRKTAHKNIAVATKSLANKLARATYYMLRDQQSFNKNMLFR
jgi:hypothetical protein